MPFFGFCDKLRATRRVFLGFVTNYAQRCDILRARLYHVPFVVNGDEYECDLLFYNLKLRCYIVVELKVVKFQPEFVSKLNFYCSAVDHLIKEDIDKETIGLLICSEKNDVVAQWTVEKSREPVGISTYELANIIPATKNILPETSTIEKSLSKKSKRRKK